MNGTYKKKKRKRERERMVGRNGAVDEGENERKDEGRQPFRCGRMIRFVPQVPRSSFWIRHISLPFPII